MMRTEDWIGKVDTMDRPNFDSWRTHVLAVMYARVRVQGGDAPHFGSHLPAL